jgi:lipopolysaccharide transport system permease protein
MYWYGLALTWTAWLILPLVVLTALLATGVGLWLAALNTYYRDVQYALPFCFQLWMFATPVVYPASIVPQPWQWLFALNPMTGLIEAYRAVMLGRPVDGITLAVATAVAVLCSIFGLRQFTRMERDFADVV